MDLRVAFRVRERKDVDLILGQGMLAASWLAHKLNAPGKFLISVPEYDTPRRARAYLVTDQAVSDAAAHYAGQRPELDEVSRLAIRDDHVPAGPVPVSGLAGAPDTPSGETNGTRQAKGETKPDNSSGAILWAALSLAPDDGITVRELMTATGMGRRWVYYRLQKLTAAGRATQTARGLREASPSRPRRPQQAGHACAAPELAPTAPLGPTHQSREPLGPPGGTHDVCTGLSSAAISEGS